ncbi:hypothetical protein FQN57_001915 [Myotisia sp. PD_48]|nr:hypothetical protein FQN57_001915 [Myotisia sp. PD_48]
MKPTFTFAGLSVFGVGFPSILFRFCAHATLGVYSGASRSAWARVRGHDILQQAPYSIHTLSSIESAARWSYIAFYWNFALWIPNALFPNILVIPTGAFDLFLLIQFGISVAQQGSWMPRKTSHCLSVAQTWQVTDGAPSIFNLTGSLADPPISAVRICETFVDMWNHGIASMVLVCLTALGNLVLGLVVFFWVGLAPRPQAGNQYKPRWIKNAWAFFWALICLLPKTIICIAEFLIRHCLPLSKAVYVRYSVRWVVKRTQSMTLPIWHKMKRIAKGSYIKIKSLRSQKKHVEKPSINLAPIENKGFKKMLHPDILFNIAPHLHYLDMVELSLTSKTIVMPAILKYARNVPYLSFTTRPLDHPLTHTDAAHTVRVAFAKISVSQEPLEVEKNVNAQLENIRGWPGLVEPAAGTA